MRLGTGLSRAEFTLLARPRATSRATDSLHLFESRLLGLHGGQRYGNPQKGKGQFCTVNSDSWHNIALSSLTCSPRRPLEPRDSCNRSGSALALPPNETASSPNFRGGEKWSRGFLLLPMPDPVRCPYCIEGDDFKIMKARGEEEWFLCLRCGHVTIPNHTPYQCNCQTCVKRRPSKFGTLPGGDYASNSQ
jgi:hypothetical protein